MKKIISSLCILISFFLLHLSCFADDLSFENFIYTILSDGTAEITGYTGQDTEISIPDAVNSIKVTSIGSSVFAHNETIEKINIPAGILSIGNSCFSESTALKQVTLPEGLQWLGDLSFQGDTALEEIILPDSLVHIGMNPFDRCNLLKAIAFSGENTFYSIQEGVLYNNKTNALVSYPFGKDETEFVIPEWVTEISAAAFSENPYINKITLSEKIKEITGNPFCGCINLHEIVVSPLSLNFEFQNNVFYNFPKKELIAYLWGSEDESFTVPNGIRSIGNEAFYKHKELTSVELPDTLVYIGDAAFAESSLTSIKFPKGVFSLGDNVCSGCTELKTVTLSSGLSQIGRYAFSECNALETIEFPKSLNVIGEGAFYKCEALTELNLPENLHYIGDYAFLLCNNLTSVDFPDHLFSIGKGAFYGPEKLTVTVSPDSLAEEWAIQSEVPFIHKNITYMTPDSI